VASTSTPQDRRVVAQGSLAERREEPWAAALADRVHEEHEPEEVDELGQLQVGVERADAEAGEEHRGHPQAHTGDLDLADEVAARRHEEEQEERVFFQVRDDVSEHRGVLLHVAFRGVEESGDGATPRFLEVSVVSGRDRAAPLAQRATRARTDPVFSWLVASGYGRSS
jgi:hypothetical protein